MRIKAIRILGFGKWLDQAFDLQGDLDVFYGGNEAGKSTLVAFIQAILFGFPTRVQNDNRYEPKTSSQYGGSLEVVDSKLGDVTVERLPDKKVSGQGRIILPDQTILDENFFQSLLSNINLQVFRQFYLFSLDDLEKINQVKPSQLEENFLNLSVSGAANYLELAADFDKKAQEIFKPSGRMPLLNQALADLKEAEENFHEADRHNASYLSLLEELKAIDQQIDLVKQRLDQERQDRDQVQFYLKNWSKIDRLQFLNQALDQSGDRIKEDDWLAFEDWLSQSQEKNNQIDHLNKELEDLQASQEGLDAGAVNLEDYYRNRASYDKLFDQTSRLVDLSQACQELDQDLSNLKRNHQDLGQDLDLDPDQEVQKIDQEDRSKLSSWLEEWRQTQSKLADLDDAIYKAETQARIRQVLQEENSQDEDSPGWLWPGLAFIVAFLLAFLFDFSFALSVILALLAAGGVYFLSQARGENQASQVSLGQGRLDQAEDIDHLQDLKAKEEGRRKQLEDRYQDFLRAKNLSQDLNLRDLISRVNFFNQYVDQAHTILDLQAERTDLGQKVQRQADWIDQQTDDFATYQDPHYKIAALNQFKTLVDQALKEDRQDQQELNRLSQELGDLNQEADQLDRKMNQVMAKYHETSIARFKKQIAWSRQAQNQAEERDRLEAFFQENKKTGDQTDLGKVNYQSLNRKDQEIQARLKEQASKKDHLIEEKSSLKLQAQKIEMGGEYEERAQILENQKAYVQDLAQKWLTYKLASDLIQETIKAGVRDQVPTILDQASDYFNRLSLGNYQSIQFKADKIQVQRQDGQIFGVKDLSRGTAEPLYAALRLAVIQFQSSKLQFPIIVDDSFVNLDPDRKKVIYDILEEISQDNQVILFTFDPSVLSRFKPDQVTNLSKL